MGRLAPIYGLRQWLWHSMFGFHDGGDGCGVSMPQDLKGRHCAKWSTRLGHGGVNFSRQATCRCLPAHNPVLLTGRDCRPAGHIEARSTYEHNESKHTQNCHGFSFAVRIQVRHVASLQKEVSIPLLSFNDARGQWQVKGHPQHGKSAFAVASRGMAQRLSLHTTHS